MKDSLGDRMKGNYENPYKHILPRRLPVIIRLDGKAFTQYTKGCVRPFDENLISALDEVGLELCNKIEGVQLAYLQSDEISLLIHNYKTLDSMAWFGNDQQKMVSVSAGMASAKMSLESIKVFDKFKLATFDSRAFVLPEAEVVNYFLWRQQDWERNSLQMLARSVYSHADLHLKKKEDLHEMLHKKNLNWSKLSTYLKRGRCIKKITLKDETRAKFVVDKEIPIFSEKRDYISELLTAEE